VLKKCFQGDLGKKVRGRTTEKRSQRTSHKRGMSSQGSVKKKYRREKVRKGTHLLRDSKTMGGKRERYHLRTGSRGG